MVLTTLSLAPPLPPNQNKVLGKFLCFSISKLLFFFLFCWFWLVGTLPIQYSSNYFLFFSLWIISMFMCFLVLTNMICVIVVLVGFFLVLCQRSCSVFMSVCRLGMKLLNTNMIYYLAYYMLPFATNNNILYNQFFFVMAHWNFKLTCFFSLTP